MRGKDKSGAIAALAASRWGVRLPSETAPRGTSSPRRHDASIDAMADGENDAPRSLRWPRPASSTAMARNDRWPAFVLRRNRLASSTSSGLISAHELLRFSLDAQKSPSTIQSGMMMLGTDDSIEEGWGSRCRFSPSGHRPRAGHRKARGVPVRFAASAQRCERSLASSSLAVAVAPTRSRQLPSRSRQAGPRTLRRPRDRAGDVKGGGMMGPVIAWRGAMAYQHP